MNDATRLFTEHFQVLSQRITGKAYAVRFVAPPYTDDAPSRLLYTDSRNPEHISGLSIIALLEKFKISESEFKTAYNEFYSKRLRA